jgi:hypothetical protein
MDAFQSPHAQRGDAVVVLQPAEFTLDGRAAPVDVAESVAMARDVREQPPARGNRDHGLIRLCPAKQDNVVNAARLAFGVDAHVVVALVHRARLGLEAAGERRPRPGADGQIDR